MQNISRRSGPPLNRPSFTPTALTTTSEPEFLLTASFVTALLVPDTTSKLGRSSSQFGCQTKIPCGKLSDTTKCGLFIELLQSKPTRSVRSASSLATASKVASQDYPKDNFRRRSYWGYRTKLTRKPTRIRLPTHRPPIHQCRYYWSSH